MSLDIEVDCNSCDDSFVVWMERVGKIFTYTWFQCTSCGETDWHSKRLRKKGHLEWANQK